MKLRINDSHNSAQQEQWQYYIQKEKYTSLKIKKGMLYDKKINEDKSIAQWCLTESMRSAVRSPV